MKRFLLLFFGVFVATACHGEGKEISCPELPAVPGLKWEYKLGPDFDVCYAKQADKNLFGIYFGTNPMFQPEKQKPVAWSLIDGQKVNWFPGFGQDKKTIGQQALMATQEEFHYMNIRENYLSYAHIFVLAKTDTEMKSVKNILEGIKFGKLGRYMDVSEYKEK